MMKHYLEATGLFIVDVARTAHTWRAGAESQYLRIASDQPTVNYDEPRPDSTFAPDFTPYAAVISNFGWRAAPWPATTRTAFERYVAGGGGFVSVHAADNSFPDWPAYNEMIGLGGWGGRDETHGPYVYYTEAGELVRDSIAGSAGAHGARHIFPVTLRDTTHPITRGLPPVLWTTPDECYAKLRGPARNLTILATGRDQSPGAPTARHEPVLMIVDYGAGRVFHTTLGHDAESVAGDTFRRTFLRGTAWAAGLPTTAYGDF